MDKVTDTAQAVSALALRLVERQQIKWMAPDKDDVLHQMVDVGDLTDVVTALTAFAGHLATPAPDSEKLREALKRAADEFDLILMRLKDGQDERAAGAAICGAKDARAAIGASL